MGRTKPKGVRRKDMAGHARTLCLHDSRFKGSRKNNLAFCCDSHAQLNHNWQTAMVCRAWQPQPCGARLPRRVSAALPLLDDITTSPASRRLASACPALAPKCQLILARTL